MHHFSKLLTLSMIFLVFMTGPAFPENENDVQKAVQMERSSFYEMAQKIQGTGLVTTALGVSGMLVSGDGDWLILSGMGGGAALSGCAVAFKARLSEK